MGKIPAWLGMLLHEGVVTSGYRTAREYDVSGKEAGFTSYEYSGGSWTVQQRETITYDAAGRLLSQVDEGANRQIYVYDSAGRQVHYESDNWKSGAWQLDLEETRGYDAQGRLVLMVTRGHYSDPDEPVGPWQKVEHTYPGPSLHEAVYWIWEGGKWIRQSLTRERLDARGKATESIGYDYTAAEPRERLKTVHAFDANDNIVDEEIYESEGGAWVLSSRTHAAFDAENRVTGYDDEGYEAGVLVSKYAYTYRYGPNGRILEWTSREISNSGQITSGTRVEYAYPGTVALSQHPPAARNRVGGAAPRAKAFLVRQGGATRDLRGRIAMPR